MKISKRLQVIADIISEGSKVIDVGCDHALLDIYLSIYKNCKCIAADVNNNALEQAKYNIKRYGVKNIETILTDGLTGINVNEDDVVVISGMGTATIEHILKNDKKPNTLIISSHNEWEHLRKTVIALGYKIEEERFVIDKRKGYIIIKFIKGEGTYSQEDLLYGPYLKQNLLYLDYLYSKEEEVFVKIPEENLKKDNIKIRLKEIQSLIEKLK